MRALRWALRVTFADGSDAFLRHGGVIGRGPIVTFYSKAKADEQAAFIRQGLDTGDVVTVIQRSHGRQALAEGDSRRD